MCALFSLSMDSPLQEQQPTQQLPVQQQQSGQQQPVQQQPAPQHPQVPRRSNRRKASRGVSKLPQNDTPPPPLSPLSPLPNAALHRARVFVPAFDDGPTWIASDWPEDRAPKSFSGFFLPLIYSGLASADGDAFTSLLATVPDSHFNGRPVATVESIAALQPLWVAVFSHWSLWVSAVRGAVEAGMIGDALSRGVSAKAAWLLPTRFSVSLDDRRDELERGFGSVPHLKPAAQNQVVEVALGPVETSRFYASIMSLFTQRQPSVPAPLPTPTPFAPQGAADRSDTPEVAQKAATTMDDDAIAKCVGALELQ